MKMKTHIVQWISAGALICITAAPVFAGQAAKKETAKPEAKPMAIQVDPLTKRPAANAESISAGRNLYVRACLFCHGVEGKGDGPVSFFLSRDTGPHPRDFSAGVYKFRSTLSGELPTDEDLFRTITNGVKGFMPAFVGLDPADRWRLVYYIKSLYKDFKGAKPELIKVVGNPIPPSASSVQRGYKLFQEFKCWECHGGGGKGNGKKAPDLKDDWDFPLPPQNLTMPSSFKNGNTPADLYRTIMSGLDGGAMPSYGDFLEGTEKDAWHLVNYILSLSQERR